MFGIRIIQITPDTITRNKQKDWSASVPLACAREREKAFAFD